MPDTDPLTDLIAAHLCGLSPDGKRFTCNCDIVGATYVSRRQHAAHVAAVVRATGTGSLHTDLAALTQRCEDLAGPDARVPVHAIRALLAKYAPGTHDGDRGGCDHRPLLGPGDHYLEPCDQCASGAAGTPTRDDVREPGHHGEPDSCRVHGGWWTDCQHLHTASVGTSTLVPCPPQRHRAVDCPSHGHCRFSQQLPPSGAVGTPTRATDEDRHGAWNKEAQRYDDGCREDRPHPAPDTTEGAVGTPTRDDVARAREETLQRIDNPAAAAGAKVAFDAVLALFPKEKP